MLAEPTLRMLEFAGVCFLPWVEKLARELLEEKVPLEAGRIGEAKLEGASCVVGGLNSCGFIPISVMWGLITSGGVCGLTIT